jgi:HemY protein
MFKFLIGIMLLAIVVLGAILFVKEDPGFLLIKYGDYSLETSLAFGIIAVAVIALLVHFIFKIVTGIWHLPVSVKRQSQSRRFSKSRKLLNQGLIDLAEGRFAQAENNLIKLVDYSESPLLHYLAAARAAQQQGKYDERDNYLRAAHEAKPEAEIAIGVTQAELQLSHNQNEQALATLMHLRSIAPRHDHLLRLLAKVHYQQKDWPALVDLLPDIRKKKLLKEDKLQAMERAAYKGFLDISADSDDRARLDAAWNKIPKIVQGEVDILLHCIGLYNQAGWQLVGAEHLIVKSLEHQWDDGLIEKYGELEAADTTNQLKRAEQWLSEYGENENLLLALGRICIRAKLWGKAQGYLEASIGVKAQAASCLALAELLGKHLQQPDKSCDYYKMGLETSLSKEIG